MIPVMIMRLAEAFLLALAVNADLFAGALALGAGGIRIGRAARVTSALVTSLALFFAVLFGAGLRELLSEKALRILGALMLLSCGLGKLFDSAVRAHIRKRGFAQKNLNFSLCGLRLMLSICADPASADLDRSKTLSAREAVAFTLTFAPDAVISGIGWAGTPPEALFAGAFAFFGTLLILPLPAAAGRRFSRLLRSFAPFFSALLLCTLGLFRLFG